MVQAVRFSLMRARRFQPSHARAMAVKTAAPSPFARLALLQNASRQLGGLLSQADKEPGTAGVSEH